MSVDGGTYRCQDWEGSGGFGQVDRDKGVE